MTDFLEEKRQEMKDRLDELRPTVEEFHRLEAAVAALDGAATPKTRRASAARGRPRGSGTRDKQAQALVQANPGITIPEIATKMGIQQNYLYRVLPRLQKEGLIRKDGRGWHPA